MGITDWLNKKKEERIQESQIRDAGKLMAQQEAQVILDERQAGKERDMLEQAKQKELERLTTSKTERIQKGIVKVGEKLSNVSEKLDSVGSKFSQGTQQLGRDIKTSTPQRLDYTSNVAPQRKGGIKDLISEDNSQTKWGQKVFGNSFTQDKKLTQGSGLGFNQAMNTQRPSLNVSNIGGFSKDNPFVKQTSKKLDKDRVNQFLR